MIKGSARPGHFVGDRHGVLCKDVGSYALETVPGSISQMGPGKRGVEITGLASGGFAHELAGAWVCRFMQGWWGKDVECSAYLTSSCWVPQEFLQCFVYRHNSHKLFSVRGPCMALSGGFMWGWLNGATWRTA